MGIYLVANVKSLKAEISILIIISSFDFKLIKLRRVRRIKTGLIWSPDYTTFKLGEGHPLNNRRFIILNHLLNFFGIFDRSDVIQINPPQATEEELLLFHTEEYIQVMKELSIAKTTWGPSRGLEYGLGTGDCPIFPDMHKLTSLVVGGTLEGAKKILAGDIQQAFAVLAGMHHGFPDRASGFCYYNDIGVTIQYLLRQGVNRILYLDTDVHHGDGVLEAYYESKNVLGISIHESGHFNFPGTGFPVEIGKNEGRGYTINLPLLPGTSDELYIQLFESIIPCLWEKFDPEFVIWQSGVDGHFKDVLGHLNLTTDVYKYLGSRVHELSQKGRTKGRLLVLSGGGYNPESTSRANFAIITSLLGINNEIPPKSPQEWVDFCYNELNIEVQTMLWDENITDYSIDEKIDFSSIYRPSFVRDSIHSILHELKEALKTTNVWNGCLKD
ncbi:MAG: acetoin utilization protein AcuC [Promethearchaeota archaeon]